MEAPALPNVARGARSAGRRAAAWYGPVLACLVLASLGGCQMDLHTKISEADANEMLGTLLAADVDARKHTPDGGKTWTISVDEAQAAHAIQVLRDNALPRERRATLGDLFKKEGLISSPTEERVRFLFGVQQSLAETLSRIDGVVVARVHIVLPNNDPLAAAVKPSSASVFIKHRRGIGIQALVPAIKNLVVHAVEGLEYSQVTVTSVAADEPRAVAGETGAAAGGRDAQPRRWGAPLLGLAALLLALAGVAAWWLMRRRAARRSARTPTARGSAPTAELVPLHAAGD